MSFVDFYFERTLDRVKRRSPSEMDPLFVENWFNLLDSKKRLGRFQKGQGVIRAGDIRSSSLKRGELTLSFQGTDYNYRKTSLKVTPLSDEIERGILDKLLQRPSLLSTLFERRFSEEFLSLVEKEGGDPWVKSSELNLSCYCRADDDESLCQHMGALFFLFGEAFSQDPLLYYRFRGVDLLPLLCSKRGNQGLSSQDLRVLHDSQEPQNNFELNNEGSSASPLAIQMFSPPLYSSANPFEREMHNVYTRVAEKATSQWEFLR